MMPGPHGSYALPQTVSELKRILRLNLAAVSPHRNTMSKSSERADRSPSRVDFAQCRNTTKQKAYEKYTNKNFLGYARR